MSKYQSTDITNTNILRVRIAFETVVAEVLEAFSISI